MNKQPVSAMGEEIVSQLLGHPDKTLVRYVFDRLSAYFAEQPTIVYHASALSTAEKQKLDAAIRTQFPHTTAVHYVQDESLVAGVKIVSGDYVYEDSVTKRLGGGIS